MKFREKLIFYLFLGVISSIVATPDKNETTISTVAEQDTRDAIYDKITALTLAHMVKETSDDLVGEESVLSIAEAALNSTRYEYEDQHTESNVSDEEIDSDTETPYDHIAAGDGVEVNQQSDESSTVQKSAETLIDLSQNEDDKNIRNTAVDQESMQQIRNLSEEKDKRVIEDVLLGMRALPDNATFWELFRAQVQADFAPILIIIPRPIKKMIATNALIVGRKLKSIIGGPLIPMIAVAGKVIGIIGNGVIYVGEDVVKLADFLVSMGDNSSVKSHQPSEVSHALQIVEEKEDIVTGDSDDDDEDLSTSDTFKPTFSTELNQIDEVLNDDYGDDTITLGENAIRTDNTTENFVKDEVQEIEIISLSQKDSEPFCGIETNESETNKFHESEIEGKIGVEIIDSKISDSFAGMDEMLNDDSSDIEINLLDTDRDIENNIDVEVQSESDIDSDTEYIEL